MSDSLIELSLCKKCGHVYHGETPCANPHCDCEGEIPPDEDSE
jgi:hypothetical protein